VEGGDREAEKDGRWKEETRGEGQAAVHRHRFAAWDGDGLAGGLQGGWRCAILDTMALVGGAAIRGQDEEESDGVGLEVVEPSG
jgi:hypothetical protein